VSGDLAWLRAQGLDVAIRRHAAGGGAVLGICGGLQVLGRSLSDPEGVDGERHSQLPGLDLLPLATHYAGAKRVVPTFASFDGTTGTWARLNGVTAPAYEIRHGVTLSLADCAAVLHDRNGTPIGWQAGPVLGVYSHGLFESAGVIRALFGSDAPVLDRSLDLLADLLDEHLDAALLRQLFTREEP
jgi:adenosylcobyric acid synthase